MHACLYYCHTKRQQYESVSSDILLNFINKLVVQPYIVPINILLLFLYLLGGQSLSKFCNYRIYVVVS